MEDCPVFTPTIEEFKDFSKYIQTIQPLCKGGIAKVIPPPEWEPEFEYEILEHLVVPHPITQYVNGNKGIYQLLLVEKPTLTLEEFKELAIKEKVPKSSKYNYDDNERIFWKNIRYQPPMYGADMPGSLFSKNTKYWNLRNLHTILDVMGSNLPGITTPYLYFGMWKAMFAWHVEDMNLFSINYLHFGQPKTWYGVGAVHGPKMERLLQGYFPDQAKQCPEFLRHKTSMVSPSILLQNNIPVTRGIQEPGQFMITFPYGYHAGFNNGFNCAEAVNFATESWIEWGKKAKSCKCRTDTVKINMDLLIERYNAFKEGLLQIEEQPDVDPFMFETNYDEPPLDEAAILASSVGGMLSSKSKSPKKKQKIDHQHEQTKESEIHGSQGAKTEEFSDDSTPRRRGKRITADELQTLERYYSQFHGTPDRDWREKIANELDWSSQGVYNWFRRRKAKDSEPSTTTTTDSNHPSPTSASPPSNSVSFSPPAVSRTPTKVKRQLPSVTNA